MVGIVLISHGTMGQGMLSSASVFFGEAGLKQVTTVSYVPENSPEEFDVMLAQAISEVDSGEGVIILADLLGGTPCNRAAYKLSDKVQVITGMNLPIFMEILGLRLSRDTNIDVETLISTGQDGILSLNKLLSEK